jgi:pimeloyl-ACP methyl ester carboxylesterase
MKPLVVIKRACAAFDLIGPALGERFYVVALELAGHGKSDHRSSDASYMGLHYAEDVIAALWSLGWIDSTGGATKPMVYLGHSLGGGLGTIVAGTLPRAFEQIVLIENMGLMTKPPEEAPSALAKAVLSELVRDTSKAGRVYPDLAAAASAREANAKMIRGQSISSAGALSLATRGTSAVEGGLTFTHDRRAQNPSALYLMEEQMAAFMGAITCPVLVVLGKDGLFKGVDWVSAFRDGAVLC